MNANEQTIARFYAAFAKLDAETMASCYANEATFSDEIFTLNGKEQVMGMWRMLTDATRSKGMDAWKLDFSGVCAEGATGQAHWDAHYRFSATGRMVLNRIDARFNFNTVGLIVTHHDHFNFWAWSRQALGLPGMVLGWTPFMRGKVQAQANSNLQKFLASR